MRKSYVTIYDLQMRKVAMLENAFGIQYAMPMNALWNASFSLPAADLKNAECQPLYFAEIFDESERIELFRILPSTLNRGTEDSITYQCEHVLGTLLDDILFQYHTVGNLGVFTSDVLEYILDRQTTARWQLGTVGFAHQFEYTWENENLLGALFSVPKPFVDEYQWSFDTNSYPWTLNLVQPSSDVQAYIRYGVNMQGITRVIDPSNVVTRLYGLGVGEGVNQLTFSDINGGKPYLDADAESISKYGLMHSVFVDRRFQSAETLKARCQALLDELKQPRATYTVRASELYALTRDPIDKFRTGVMVRVQDKEIGEDVRFRVLNVRKQDVIGAPGDVEIEIANRPQDLAGTIAELRNRQYISDVYAQGATNWDSHDFADNCDPTHPVVLKFWVPEEAVRINKILLSYECQPFRAYEQAIEAAPATTSGASSITTTASGGTPTSGPSSTTTTTQIEVDNNTVNGIIVYDQDYVINSAMEIAGMHNHGIPDGAQLALAGGGSVTFSWSGSHDHRLSRHLHDFVSDPHTHGMDHVHTIAPHTHDMPHTHQIPAHTHGIQFGIFEGATPSSVTVKVDGNTIPGLGTSESDVDLVNYLSKDSSGRIQRGAFHEIEIAPNSLGRIVATVVTQIFVQSRGGGDY